MVKPLVLPMTTSNRQFYKYDAIPLSIKVQQIRLSYSRKLPEIFKQFKLPQ
jgi:hypothetical protein